METRKAWRLRPATLTILLALFGASVTPLVSADEHCPDTSIFGAIFTTTPDGTVVNENVRYAAKWDVFLDGGPRANAPLSAAALPDGHYYFQVTDPSGKRLLSEDRIACREVKVENGVIIEYLGPEECREPIKYRGKVLVPHLLNDDFGEGEPPREGAKVVRLWPFEDTPNPGGVYKTWMTPTCQFTGDKEAEGPEEFAAQGQFHGFVPRYSKTDNFKVKEGRPQYGIIALRNYHDANLNCRLDLGEYHIWDWQYELTVGGVVTGKTTSDETPGDPTTVTLEELLGNLQNPLMLDQYRWTPGETAKNTDSLYVTTSAYVHKYLDFDILEAQPGRWMLEDEVDGYLRRFVMEMVCKDGIDDDGLGPQTANEFTVPTPPEALGVLAINDPDPQIVITMGETGFAQVPVMKVYDRGQPGQYEPGTDQLLQGWPVTLTYAPNLLESVGPVPPTIKSDAAEQRIRDLYQEIADRFFAGSAPDPLLVNGMAERKTGSNGLYRFNLLLPNEYGGLYDAYELTESLNGFIGKALVIFEDDSSTLMDAAAVKFDVCSEAVGTGGDAGRTPPIMGRAYLDQDGKLCSGEAGDIIKAIVYLNRCTGKAAFSTKGYWHNKNGLAELKLGTGSTIAGFNSYLNGNVHPLAPYGSPSSYFGAGDEPFDGEFSDGSPVAQAFNNEKLSPFPNDISAFDEVSHFLIDANANGDPREQLAQQLLAFIFNVDFRIGSHVTLILPDSVPQCGFGSEMGSDGLIQAAVNAWSSGSDSQRNCIKTLLDTFNNTGGDGQYVHYVVDRFEQCPNKPAGVTVVAN